MTLLIDPEATAASTAGNEQSQTGATQLSGGNQGWEYRLDQSRPNPFSQQAVISFQLQVSSLVALKIFNTAGQLVRTLVTGNLEPGTHEVIWDGRAESGEQAATGVYFYRLEAGSFNETRRMVLMR